MKRKVWSWTAGILLILSGIGTIVVYIHETARYSMLYFPDISRLTDILAISVVVGMLFMVVGARQLGK